MIIKDWEGRDIQGECSGGGVFSAFNWRDLVLATGGPNGRAIERKAARSSRGLSAYDPAIHAALKARDGRYCSLQSINSEDTVTWSIFGVYPIDFWIEDLLNLTFGSIASMKGWRVRLWRRLPHPETGGANGPEADVFLESDAAWSCAIEAKWPTSDIDPAQGQSRNKTQLEIRAECNSNNQLVVAPQPSRYYRFARNSNSVFRRYFEVIGNKYKPTSEANSLGVKVITWEQIEEILARRTETEATHIASYLRWRLTQLPMRR